MTMLPPNGQSRNLTDQQKQKDDAEENSRGRELMKSASLTMNNRISREQQFFYSDNPENYLSNSNFSYYASPDQVPINPMVHQFLLVRLTSPHYYQSPTTTYLSMPPALLDLSMIPPDMEQQQTVLPTIEPLVDIPALPPASMTDSAVSASSISSEIERDHSDISGASKLNRHIEPEYPVMTRVFYSNNLSNRRPRESNQQPTKSVYARRFFQNQPVELDRGTTSYWVDENGEHYQFSSASIYTATSSFQFAPFWVDFFQKVDEMSVVDELIKHALNNSNFQLEIITYRCSSTDNRSHITIYVENNESFVYLYDGNNWPETLANCQFKTKIPLIPPQLALILTTVPFDIDWDVFVRAIKEKYIDIFEVIRLKTKAQITLRTVKLGFKTVRSRNEVFQAGKISVMHMKLKVYELFPRANVLMCGNCMEIGHHRTACPQKRETTCSKCGGRYPILKVHRCSEVFRCIRCGGPHRSNEFQCPVLRNYQAALSQYLLSRITSSDAEYTNSALSSDEFPYVDGTLDSEPCYTVAQMMPFNPNDEVSEKLSNVLEKVKEKAAPNGSAFYRLRTEMRNRYEETKQKVDMLEKTVQTMEKKFEDLSKRIL